LTVVGVDIGATKTHLAVTDGDRPIDLVVPTTGWRVRRDEEDAHALLALARKTAGAEPAVIVVGAHGCDDTDSCLAFQSCLAALTRGAVLVVNDAELLVPAAGFDHGVGVVAGTGSIAVARLPDRTMLVAGGWGWLLGDEGGAVGLVREAARAVRGALDSGYTTDPLIGCLCRSLGAANPIQFGHKLVEAGGAAAIGGHVSAVFEAAAMGSDLARTVIREGGAALARLVRQLVGRGATGREVVAAGGVITRQDALMAAFREALETAAPEWRITLLAGPPVQGALALARRIASGKAVFGFAPTPPAGRKALE
jgi:glucosamine kinase